MSKYAHINFWMVSTSLSNLSIGDPIVLEEDSSYDRQLGVKVTSLDAVYHIQSGEAQIKSIESRS